MYYLKNFKNKKEMVVMKKQRILGILVLITLMSVPAKAGWISDFGRRITEGAKNTIKNNLQNKVNRSIDNAMDGKLGKQQKSTNSIKGKNEYQGNPERSISKSGSDIKYDEVDTTGMLDLKVVEKKALPFTGKYQEIDLDVFKFQGERIYSANLMIGEQAKDIDAYLHPGFYLICFVPRTWDANVHVGSKAESEGVEFGYGLRVRKRLLKNDIYSMNGKDGSAAFILEAGKTGGHIDMVMVNEMSKRGAMEVTIFKIPGPDAIK
jgi:hypothetical protein